MTGVLRWEVPPPPSRAGRRPPSDGWSRFASVAAELRSRQGEWGVVFEGAQGSASAMASHIRLGQQICFTPSGDFDACARRLGDGLYATYAVYVGDPS
jgi:hypothetical protein